MKSLEQTLDIRTMNSDLCGVWRPSAILEACQEIAGDHSETMGLGRKELLEKNLVWILSRNEVEILRYPAIGQKIRIETFHRPNRHWFFPRYFVFRTMDSREILGYCGSMWVLMDLETRKAVSGREIAALMPDNSDMEPPMDHLPSMVHETAGDCETHICRPVYSDLDANMHVNNARYLDWVCNSLGIECMEKNEIGHFVINYDAEILPDQQVELRLKREGDRFSVSGSRDGVSCFAVEGSLRARQHKPIGIT